jgi:ATP-dependent protease ClpP protease subunit
MPTWGQLLQELKKVQEETKQPPFDSVRRRYLAELHSYTKRNTILYATKWTQPGGVGPEDISINEEDVQGLMEVIFEMKTRELDLVLHSPGGSPEATEAVVTYLRSKFDDIRVIIPHAAMSAATMLACAANRVVMGKHSFLGPIDPQFILQTPLGIQAVPAQAILDQFKRAQEECKDPKALSSWLPILSQYGPALLVQCDNAIELSQQLVTAWLQKYMFAGQARETAEKIAWELSRHGSYKSHGRHISIESAKELGLVVDALEADHSFQEKVLSVFHAAMHTFAGTPAVKIVENNLGRAYIKMQQRILIPKQPQAPPST